MGRSSWMWHRGLWSQELLGRWEPKLCLFRLQRMLQWTAHHALLLWWRPRSSPRGKCGRTDHDVVSAAVSIGWSCTSCTSHKFHKDSQWWAQFPPCHVSLKDLKVQSTATSLYLIATWTASMWGHLRTRLRWSTSHYQSIRFHLSIPCFEPLWAIQLVQWIQCHGITAVRTRLHLCQSVQPDLSGWSSQTMNLK